MSIKGVVILNLLSIFLLSPGLLHSQFSHSVHYTVNDGLPSSKVYDMLLDNQGYMWFATENGVSRYNGYNFTNFTTLDGLPTNSTLKLYEDIKGRIWFMSYQGQLSYYENGEIYLPWFNNYLHSNNISFVADLFVDEEESIWLSLFNGGLLKIDSLKNIQVIGKKRIASDTVIVYVKKFRSDEVVSFVNELNNSELDDVQSQTYQKNNIMVTFPILPFEHHVGYLELPEKELVYLGRKIFVLENGVVKEEYYFENEIVCLYADQQNNVWIAEKFNGISAYSGSLSEKPDYFFFPNNTVSEVIQDDEGSYWFSNTENGVYYVPSLKMSSYNKINLPLQNDIILAMEIMDDDICFSTDSKKLYIANVSDGNLSNVESLELSKEYIDNINAILFYEKDIIYVAGDYQASEGDNLAYMKSGKYDIYSAEYGYGLKKLFNNDVAVIYTDGIRYFREANIIDKSKYDGFNLRTFAIQQMADSSIWLGTIDGLYVAKNRIFTEKYPDHHVLSSRISAIANNNLLTWVGSFDNGLSVIAPDKIHYIHLGNGLASNRVKSLFIENDSIVWVGTNKGLNRVQYRNDSTFEFSINSLDIWDGLPSNEINVIKKHGNYIWVATSGGLVSFNPDEIQYNKSTPRLHLLRIILNSKDTISAEKLNHLKYNEHDLNFEFNGISFKDPGTMQYQYKLNGLQQNWQLTNNTTIRFHNLNPGTYELILKAKNKRGVTSEPLSYPIIIAKHFTQTFLFYAIIVLLIFGFVFLVFYVFYRTQKNESKLQRQVILAEQKAVLSQMNPHFIFNSLNSIQNFILENDGENANNYLVIFSSLIRKILDISQKNFISLKEEIDTIKPYLELEKFRFVDKFDFIIKISPEIHPENITIPSLIMQPYLENAIWHGLVPKKEKGILEVEIFKSNSGYIQIQITDNGIGRKKAAEIRSRRKYHKPRGMKNVEERLSLLNELNKTNMRMEIVDRYDEKGNASGTRVIFHLDI